MKVLQVGESNVHVQNFCRAIRPYLSGMDLLTESRLDVPEADRTYVIPFRGYNFLNWLSGIRKLKNILRTSKPDLIHIHQVNRLAYLVVLLADRLGIPVVTTAWGSDVLLVPGRSVLHKLLVHRVLVSSRCVTADAQVMVDAMQRITCGNSSKYVLLQYGIDPVAAAEREDIIFSNRLHRPLYNIDTILKDFSEFSKNHPSWKLVVAASGPLTGELKELTLRLGIADRVEFPGWLDKNRNAYYYSRSRIFVSIPSSDGTSVSLLEAMSAECIPVVSDLPVTGEWISDGENGVVRKQGRNPFTEALTIDLESCIRLNRELISAKVDRRNTTKEFFTIYQKALGSL